jgi:hypothetical protein
MKDMPERLKKGMVLDMMKESKRKFSHPELGISPRSKKIGNVFENENLGKRVSSLKLLLE